MKIKTSELKGKALDWAVAICEGAENLHHDGIANYWFTLNNQDRVLSDGWSTKQNWHPSTDWSQGGLILEAAHISIGYERYSAIDGRIWDAVIPGGTSLFLEYGPTPLIAVMRCYVASKLGDEVEIPDVLPCTVGRTLQP